MHTARSKLTKKRQRSFIQALCECGNVSEAAQVAGTTRDTVYKHRKKDPEFAEAWEAAIEQAADRLERIARARAEGWDETHYGKDGTPYVVHKYSDVLMIFLLKGIRPEKYRERHDVNSKMKMKGKAQVVYRKNGREAKKENDDSEK